MWFAMLLNNEALRRAAGLAALVLALSPVSTPGTAQEPLVFGVIGDSGEVTPGLRGVAREMLEYRRERARFDFVLMLGDNIYSDGVGRGIQKVFEAPFADLLAAGVQFYAGTRQPRYSPGDRAANPLSGVEHGRPAVLRVLESRRSHRLLRARFDGPFRGGQCTRDCREGTTRQGAGRARAQEDADGVGTTAACRDQRRARRRCRLHQGAGSRQERPAGLARRDAGEIPGTMESSLFAPLDLFRRHERPRTRS